MVKFGRQLFQPFKSHQFLFQFSFLEMFLSFQGLPGLINVRKSMTFRRDVGRLPQIFEFHFNFEKTRLDINFFLTLGWLLLCSVRFEFTKILLNAIYGVRIGPVFHQFRFLAYPFKEGFGINFILLLLIFNFFDFGNDKSNLFTTPLTFI